MKDKNGTPMKVGEMVTVVDGYYVGYTGRICMNADDVIRIDKSAKSWAWIPPENVVVHSKD